MLCGPGPKHTGAKRTSHSDYPCTSISGDPREHSLHDGSNYPGAVAVALAVYLVVVLTKVKSMLGQIENDVKEVSVTGDPGSGEYGSDYFETSVHHGKC